jgi:hypothetical protein
MAQPNPALTSPPEAPPEVLTEALPEDSPAQGPSFQDVVQLLGRAARLAAEGDVETDLFMQAAWEACLDARPGLREELEDKELRAQLKKLRKRGLIAAA